MPELIKVGDSMQSILRQFVNQNKPFDFSDPKYRVFVSYSDLLAGSAIIIDRDITDYQTTSRGAVPSNGIAAIPLFKGRGRLSDGETETTTGTDAAVTVTFPAAGGSVVEQRVYMTKAGSTTPFYLVAKGNDGDFAGGVRIGDPAYSPPATVTITGTDVATPGADSTLIELDGGLDESITIPDPVIAPIGSAPGAVLTVVASSSLDPGSHVFATMNVHRIDSAVARLVGFELNLFDAETGCFASVPVKSVDEIEFTEKIV